jgi:hypothetical protein
MESSLTEQEKAGLSARRALLNPVELQYNLNQAIDNLLAVHKAKVIFSKELYRNNMTVWSCYFLIA